MMIRMAGFFALRRVVEGKEHTCHWSSANPFVHTLIQSKVDMGTVHIPRVRPHHQKRAMAARRMAERKTWAQRS